MDEYKDQNMDRNDDNKPGFTHRQVDQFLALLNRWVSAYEKSVDQSQQIQDLTAKLKSSTDELGTAVAANTPKP